MLAFRATDTTLRTSAPKEGRTPQISAVIAMHIMEVVSGTGMNGAILHCVLVAREFVRRGHQVTVVCYPDSWVASRLVDSGAEIIHSDLHRWPADELRRIARIARERNVDVIHTHNSRSNFFGILLRLLSGIPSVATAHSRHIQLHWMFNDRVIAASEATARYQRRFNFVRASRLDLVYNFVDPRHVAVESGAVRQRVRGEFGADARCLLVAAVGNVIPRKGQLHLVEAMPHVLDAVPEARLLVVGDHTNPAYSAEVHARAKSLGVESSIHWAGNRADVAEILRACDLFVLGSREETLPLAILEAMAAGLPVVATNVGGVPECVLQNQTGVLVPAGDSNALAEALVGLLRDEDLRRRLGRAGRERVLRHFSVESQAPKIESVFQRSMRPRAA